MGFQELGSLVGVNAERETLCVSAIILWSEEWFFPCSRYKRRIEGTECMKYFSCQSEIRLAGLSVTLHFDMLQTGISRRETGRQSYHLRGICEIALPKRASSFPTHVSNRFRARLTDATCDPICDVNNGTEPGIMDTSAVGVALGRFHGAVILLGLLRRSAGVWIVPHAKIARVWHTLCQANGMPSAYCTFVSHTVDRMQAVSSP